MARRQSVCSEGISRSMVMNANLPMVLLPLALTCRCSRNCADEVRGDWIESRADVYDASTVRQRADIHVCAMWRGGDRQLASSVVST
jgi:hypothetical protein